MERENPSVLEFLFAGPLFSIFKGLNHLRKDIMGLKETIDGYASRVTTATTEIRNEIGALQTALTNAGQISPEVQQSLDNLGSAVSGLESAEAPSVVPTTDPGTVTSDPSSTPTDSGASGDPVSTDQTGSTPTDSGASAPSDPSATASSSGDDTNTVV